MQAWAPNDLARQLTTGLLSFPVTHFDSELEVDEARYRNHLAWQSGYPVAGLFAAGGTGEGFSLSSAEISRVVRIAVDETAGSVPIIAPATGGVATAIEQARDAEAAGAAGILLFPPYLTEADQEGLAARVAAVCESTALGVIVYNRANGVLDDVSTARLADAHPNFVALKDGLGNIEHLTRIYSRVGDRLAYIGGLPTAETFALPLLELGVNTYSSAIFNFAPEWSIAFYDAVVRRDRVAVYEQLSSFVLPYLDIRDRGRGFSVSIIKAGLTAIGRDGGRVRPPLHDLSAEQVAELAELIRRTAPVGARA